MANFRSALLSMVAMSLAAQEGQGFSWVGVQGGAVAFDPASNVGSAPCFGGQYGTLLAARRYGFSLEFQQSRPESNLTPGFQLTHRALSATFLNGLSTEPASAWWPYFGVGLGALTTPRYDPATHLQEARTSAAAHLSLGFLHRPGAFWIWGAEARTRVVFTKQDMSEAQVTLLAGFSWGGAPPRPLAPATPPVVVTPTGPAPAPVPPPRPTPAPGPVAPAPPPAPVATPAPAPIPESGNAPVPPPTPGSTQVPPVVPPAPGVAPPPAIPPSPTPRAIAEPPIASELAARLAALRQGDMPRALALGQARIRSLGPNRWTLRLEIANLPSTLKGAVEAYGEATPDLFVAPIKLRTGKTAYQLFLGSYATRAEAEAAGRGVPAFFKDGGRPLPMLVGEIPSAAR